MNSNLSIGLLILRVSLGLMMLGHGINKLAGIDGIMGMLSSKGIPSFIAYGVYIGEIVAPLMIIIGWRTRLAAAIFAFNILVATLLVHPDYLFAIGEKGEWKAELQGLYFFGALALVFTGAGKYALDKR